MTQVLTAREFLNGGRDGFDPMCANTSEIKELSDALPRDGNIDLNNAEVLATKYLRGADLCSDWLAIATAHVQKLDALKKKMYSQAALVKASSAGIKTDKSRAWFAEMDDEYIDACNKYAEAIAFVKWVTSKYDSFIRMHYLCKNIMRRGTDQEKTANWNEISLSEDAW